jgi:hypothetical protein
MNTRSEVCLVDADLTTVAAAIADNEVISQSIELKHFTGEKGACSIIQSITLNSDDAETPAIDLIFTQVNTAITNAPSEAIGNSVADLDAAGASVLGVVSLSNYANHVDFVTATKLNVGLVVKAATDSTSIYVHAINRSGGNFTPTGTDDLHLRVGYIRS